MKLVKENIRFERDQEPKTAMGVGKGRFKQPGDVEFGNKFYRRKIGNRPRALIINAENGKELEVSFYALKEVIEALEALI